MLSKFAMTAALVAALPLPASAGLDHFLKIDSIRGETSDSKHKDEIEVLEWSWGVTNTGSVTSGGGGGAGKSLFSDFRWKQDLDSSYVPMFLGVAEGKHFKSAVLSVRRDGPNDQDFFKMTLSDVLLNSLQTQAVGDSFEVRASLTYGKVEMSYRALDAHGALGPEIKGGWDLRLNKVTFTGDPAVVLGLVEAGGNLNFVSGVPEPSTWASLAAGLGLLGVMARRRRAAPQGTGATG